MSLDNKLDLRWFLWGVTLSSDADFQRFLFERTISISVNYYEHGQDDDFEIQLDNKDGIFSNEETFKEGDIITVEVNDPNRDIIKMGEYEIDDIIDESSKGEGARVRISGLAANPVKKDLKTLKTRGFENTSLQQIVRAIAQEHGLNPLIAGKDVPFERKEQKEEHDLRFINRMAEEYGYNFRIKENNLYFIQQEIDESQPGIDLEGIILKHTFRRKNYKVYKKAKVRYMDPQDRQLKTAAVEDSNINNVEEMKVTARAESREQAEDQARARLKKKNKHRVEGEIETMGATELKAGINVTLTDKGTLYNGLWHVEESKHTYTKGEGYKVSMKAYRLEDNRQPANPEAGDVPLDAEPIPDFIESGPIQAPGLGPDNIILP